MAAGLLQKVYWLAAGLSGLLLVLLLWGAIRLLVLSDPDPIEPAGSALRVGTVNYQKPDTEGDSEMILRPLFWQGRRPLEDEVDLAAAARAARETEANRASRAIDEVKLLGVYRGAEPGAIVLYQGKQRRIRLNESIEDWTWTQFSANGVIFESGDEFREMALQHAVPGAKDKKASKQAKKRADQQRNRQTLIDKMTGKRH